MNSFSDEKKVSVIIPTYNRANFIPCAVESIINQQYENIEIIIVDDHSDDNTKEVVESLQEKHPVITYCHNNRMKGPSGARNTGLLMLSGDYVAFLDSDDTWIEGHLAKGVTLLNDNPEIDVLFGNFTVIDHENRKHKYNFFDQKKILHTLKTDQISPGIKLLKDNLFKALLQENFFHIGSSIIRISVMNGIMMDEAITYAEDRDFAIQLYKTAKATFAYRDNPSYALYTHDSSLCSVSKDTNQTIINSHIHLLEKYLMQFNMTIDEKKIIKEILATKLSNTAYLYGKNKDYANAFSSMLRSFRYNLTFDQFRDIMKILMTVIYVPKSTYCKPVNRSR